MIFITAKDGPQIGQPIAIDMPGQSLGGRGSRSDLKLSGIPNGLDLARIEYRDGGWWLTEVKPSTVLLNGRKLKRLNPLKTGDEFALPSLSGDDVIRYDVRLEAAAGKTAKPKATVGKIHPAVMFVGLAYLGALVAAGLYFAIQGGGDDAQSQLLGRTQLAEIIQQDITTVTELSETQTKTTALLNELVNLDDLGQFLASNAAPEDKAAQEQAFKSELLDTFFLAWRLEQQNRWKEAEETYERVLKRTSNRQLQITDITLERLEIARSNSGIF